jgi:hypothetical protein
LRTDSQDAWIFQAPLNESLTNEAITGFHMGAPRCDNVLAHLLEVSGHPVQNPAFALHAIEIEVKGTRQSRFLYDSGVAVPGKGQNILLSDRHIF